MGTAGVATFSFVVSAGLGPSTGLFFRDLRQPLHAPPAPAVSHSVPCRKHSHVNLADAVGEIKGCIMRTQRDVQARYYAIHVFLPSGFLPHPARSHRMLVSCLWFLMCTCVLRLV